ncbi:hypothetical protein GCM10011607_28630 [Shewanella inventionis]|uniref:Pilus assembly protein PilP n=1 Tax=Shewanella inventionis TaxID=1738770 RepID=A0ABQ1JDJ4_9GAMM|nr:hypothetical protein [Shewanella inventionis]GGB66226.1 hypothetical protein GCM10011607_28630 [Shewanella inventionis]
MNLNIKNWDSKTKVKAIALLIFVIASGAYLMPESEVEAESVSFGEPMERSFEAQPSGFDSIPNTAAQSQGVNQNASSPASTPRPEPVSVPKFNFIVELAKVIDNVQNKPEAMLDYKYALSEQMLEKRAKLQELVARETTAKLKEMTSKKEMNDLTPGMSVASSLPTSDINESTVNKALFEYNYQPSDFSLTNVRSTIDGLEAIIEYRGEFYTARKGRDLLTMVKVLNITSDRVELSTPNIKSFNVVLKL